MREDDAVVLASMEDELEVTVGLLVAAGAPPPPPMGDLQLTREADPATPAPAVPGSIDELS